VNPNASSLKSYTSFCSFVHVCRMAVWGQKWYIVCPLVLISFGHFSLLLHGILLTATWVGQGCVITSTDSEILAASFIYGMAFDFTVLLLTGFKLFRPFGARSKLIDTMFADGLYYFIIAYVYETLDQSWPRPLLISVFPQFSCQLDCNGVSTLFFDMRRFTGLLT
jgi:hypothetical protein